MSRALFLILTVACSAVPAAAGELPTLEEILDRYVAALGGREALAALDYRHIAGREIDDRPHAGPPVESKLEVWAARDGDWIMEMTKEGEVWREGASGGMKWEQKPGDEVVSGEYQHTKLAFLFNPQGPLMVEKYFPNPRVTGTWSYDGVEYYKVENDLKFEYYTLYFEVETGLLTRIGYHWKLEGLREVDGVLVPAMVFQGRKGGSTNLYFDEVTHGSETPEPLLPGGK